jgi:hypothetical protein
VSNIVVRYVLRTQPPCPAEIMTTFPEEVLTRTKRGEIEVRSLIDRGRYVRYNYLHPETGQPMEGGKVKLVLLAESGKTEEFFIIPTKSGRDLLIHGVEKGARKIWDGTQSVDV